jgi:5'(3')-deoxyribonucleotidase
MIRIAIDFDNVLADTTGVWIKYYNRMYNKSLNKSEIQEYYFWDRLGISEEEAFKLFSIVWSNWKDLPLLETYSPTIVNELGKTSQVDIVTSAISSVGNSERKY